MLNHKEDKITYEQVYDYKNLILAYEKARKGKTLMQYVIKFEEDLWRNLYNLHIELKNQTYSPKPLKTFIITDPKTRRISKSAFRDRIVHHALVRIIEPIFDKAFIYDSCANRTGKGTLFAINRFSLFKRKVTKNFTRNAFCLKADIRHYFDEVNRETLIRVIRRKILDERIIGLIRLIINNFESEIAGKGMPLGNLTSQFFANVYLNELDYFAKHKLKTKHYIRYVDDFIILHKSQVQLMSWKEQIDLFLKKELKLELHPQKSKIIPLKRGIDFVGFRNFLHYRLLRKRSIKNMERKIMLFKNGEISKEVFIESIKGWLAHASWANSHNLKVKMKKEINDS